MKVLVQALVVVVSVVGQSVSVRRDERIEVTPRSGAFGEDAEDVDVLTAKTKPTPTPMTPTTPGRDREDGSQQQLEQELEQQRPLSCIAWRAVKGCSPEDGERHEEEDRSCDSWIDTGLSGWCECELDFIVREVPCRHEIFRCRDACAARTIADAVAKQEPAERAETAQSDQVAAEFMAEAGFDFEYTLATINHALGRNLPFAIFMLCDCAEDLRWGPAIKELKVGWVR